MGASLALATVIGTLYGADKLGEKVAPAFTASAQAASNNASRAEACRQLGCSIAK